MDPELLKAASELAKHIPEAAAALGGTKIFSETVLKILGPAANEVGQWGADKIKAYRTKNGNAVLNGAGRMLQDASIEPHPVPTKVLLPLLEAASLEDDEDMQKMWAALLANATLPDQLVRSRPGFIATLRVMSVDEALLLKWMCDHPDDLRNHNASALAFDAQVALGFVSKKEANLLHWSERLSVGLHGLLAHQLAVEIQWVPARDSYDPNYGHGSRPTGVSYAVSPLGRSFIDACTPPKPAQQ